MGELNPTRQRFAPLGAIPEPGGTRFRVWTTKAKRVSVRLEDEAGAARRVEALEPVGEGVFEGLVSEVGDGALYRFVLDGRVLPDPYARLLPRGVHGPARVVESGFRARHPLRPLSPSAVIYELHLGTFTPQGTYRGAIGRLPDVADLGAQAIQLMPVSAFPGTRGWGYDGVAHFAPYAGYGSPDDLRELIDAAHGLGLSVVLDVVYNHFGPSGNYLGAYSGEYFAKKANLWGTALDFTSPRMRAYVLDNALYWLESFGFDGFRLDATPAIVDPSPTHILAELAELVHGLEPRRVLIAEDDRNQPALVTRDGMDAILADDFHHAVHSTLTGEHDGYCAAFEGTAAEIARTIDRGWRFEGEMRLGKPHGVSAAALAASHLVYCIQNHDQVGNRAYGGRLEHLIDLDAYCAASVLLLTLPMGVLLFMGQEWAASAPFHFFTDHGDDVGPKVMAGRRHEFRHFDGFSDPEIPDAQDERSFASSKLDWDERSRAPHAGVLALHRELLRLRREDPVLANGARDRLTARAEGDTLTVDQWHGGSRRRLLVRFDGEIETLPEGWTVLLRTPRAVLLGCEDSQRRDAPAG